MRFEWAEKKRLSNLEKHKLDFKTAYQVWKSKIFVAQDKRRDYSEQRWTVFGILDGRVMVIVYTKRIFNVIRLISFRKANQREVKYYENAKK